MTHPLIPQITALANPIAQKLNFEIANIVFHSNKNPSLLRIDIRNKEGDTSLDDCEQMSRLLEEALETQDIIAEAYALEISSPGVADVLITDREFISFQGFPVMVETHTPHKNKTEFEGTLRSRDENFVYLNCKGRIVKIPRELVGQVTLRSVSE